MSADLNTSITFHGNKEELSSVMKVLRTYETEKLEQYRTQRNCGYINRVTVSGESCECRTEKMTDEEIDRFASTSGTKVIINASGPWGVFRSPGDVGLFEAIADAAPEAVFTGHMDGFITGADVGCSVELCNGLMHISEYNIPNEEYSDKYALDFKKKLPYAKFCTIFKVDKEAFDKDSYEDFICDAGDEGFPGDIDYDSFIDLCDGSEIDEDMFEKAIEKVASLGIVDFETFMDDFDPYEYAEEHIYDPKTQTYSKPGSGTKCQNLTFAITGKVSIFKNRDAFAEYVELQGGKVSGSVSKSTNYLVNNDAKSESSKNKKARELNVPIITEAEFIEKFGC